MTPSSVCGRVWPTWISNSGTWGPGKVPKTIWPRRIHTVIGKLKEKSPILFLKDHLAGTESPPSTCLPNPSATLPPLSFVHLNKCCWREDKGQPKQATEEGRYKSSKKCGENIPRTSLKEFLAKVPNFSQAGKRQEERERQRKKGKRRKKKKILFRLNYSLGYTITTKITYH